MNKHIAIIHPSEDMLQFLQNLLVERGYTVSTYSQGVELLNKLTDLHLDLLISSYELLDIDGETLFSEVNKVFPELPVILVGAVRDEDTVANLLKHQKCEFMLQPIVPVELLARVKVLIDPDIETNNETGNYVVADLELDPKTKRAKRGSKNIILTPTEYRLLEYLMENTGIVVSREMILNRVWNTNDAVSDRIVDVYIGYLREKIDTGFKTKLISTSTGFGYSLGKN